MELKKTFNRVIADYDFARPQYPLRLYEDIMRFSGIDKYSRLLEIGAGTGQSTDFFKHYDITALEIGKDQEEFLKTKYRGFNNVRIIRKPFESYKSKTQFDLIFSATAFHWIKPESRYAHSYELLVDGGTLAVYWITTLNRKFNDDIQRITEECLPGITVFYDDEYFNRVHQYRVSEMERSLFRGLGCTAYHWNEKYSANKYVALLNTFEVIQNLPKEKRAIYLKKISEYINDGDIIIPHKVELYMMKK